MISAVVLAHNNEAIIARTLESLGWCDEVLVIDDYSRDATLNLAKKFKAQVFRRYLNGDFASQRNFGLAKAKGEWLFFIDSDEVVSPQLASEIKETISGRRGAINGYYLKRKDFFLGRWLDHGETSRVKLLRLARKGTGVWTRPVHEIWQVKGEVGKLNHPLLHYPHPNVAQFLEEINFYSSLNAAYLKSQGIKASIWHIIGYPLAKFCLNYFWYSGFLDGMPGAIMALMMSFHSFLTRAKLYLLWRRTK